MKVLEEEVTRHIGTIENLEKELQETKSIKDEIETEYVKLTEEHEMLQKAIEQDKDMMNETKTSIQKVKYYVL